MIRVNWDVEELVALIDLYIRERRGELSDLDAELEELSKALNRRAVCLDITHDEKYRNMNGMTLMYQNVDYIATSGSRGMSAYSEAMRIVYEMSQLCPEAFQLVLKEFNTRYRQGSRYVNNN